MFLVHMIILTKPNKLLLPWTQKGNTYAVRLRREFDLLIWISLLRVAVGSFVPNALINVVFIDPSRRFLVPMLSKLLKPAWHICCSFRHLPHVRYGRCFSAPLVALGKQGTFFGSEIALVHLVAAISIDNVPISHRDALVRSYFL